MLWYLERDLGYLHKIFRGLASPDAPPDDVHGQTREKPWIAALDAFAIGGHCQILLTMDYVLAADDAFMTLPARKEGIIPGASNLRLPRFVGDRLARQLIQYERKLVCDSAEGRLICDEIAPAAEMDAAISRVAAGLTNSGAVSAAANRRAIRIGQESLDLFRSYAAVYAREQAYCHFSPALISNLERFWDAQNSARADRRMSIAPDIPTDRQAALAFDLKRLDPAFLADPFPFAALREHDPVHRGRTRVLLRHGLSRPRGLELGQDARFPPELRRWAWMSTTPPAWCSTIRHTSRVRKPLAPASRRARRGAAAAHRGPGRPADRPSAGATSRRRRADRLDRGSRCRHPGPAHRRHARHSAGRAAKPRGWSLAILGALEPVLSPEQLSPRRRGRCGFKAYLRDLVERRRREQRDDDGEVLSALIAGSEFAPAGDGAGGGGRLSERELLHNCIFILNAGHETTTNLIGNGVDLLIRHPDVQRELRDRPELIASAVEEFLRMESSNQLGNRRAASDTALGGVAMPQGSRKIGTAPPTATLH